MNAYDGGNTTVKGKGKPAMSVSGLYTTVPNCHVMMAGCWVNV